MTGCQYDWCSEIGAITVVQFMFGYVCSLLGYPFCIALCGSIFTKVLGPVPQVGPQSHTPRFKVFLRKVGHLGHLQ